MMSFQTLASFIKLEHTVFSLPLVYAGAWIGSDGNVSWRLAALMLIAAASTRMAAMSLNRLIDREIDRRNPRTAQRELPAGRMTPAQARGVVIVSLIVYAAAAWAIAPICVWLAPIPVVAFVAYPYLKRFTNLAHLGLGLTWSLAPLGGWIAAKQSLIGLGEVGWLWLFSVLWVTGFDIIYATMDEAFDRAHGLHSLPASIGKSRALFIAEVFHALAFGALTCVWLQSSMTLTTLLFLVGAGGLFIWQHAIASRRPAFAFFELNAVLGVLVFGLVVTGGY